VWNNDTAGLSPVVSFGDVHHRFETIHHLPTGTGARPGAGVMGTLSARFRFASYLRVDEFLLGRPPRYYAALDAVRREGHDLTSWLGYCAEGSTEPWSASGSGMGQLSVSTAREKLVLRPRQEQLLKLARPARRPDAGPTLGGVEDLQAGGDGFAATARQSRAGAAGRHIKERALRPKVNIEKFLRYSNQRKEIYPWISIFSAAVLECGELVAAFWAG